MNIDMDIERILRLKAEFLRSEFGEFTIPALSEMYNRLHHEAEIATDMETKAFKTERAAGIRMVIDFFTEDIAIAQSGLLNEESASENDDDSEEGDVDEPD